jgi:hydroxyacylglutathione hydrolase
MILEQYYLGCLAHASYLLGDKESGIAVVVDPQRDIDRYLEEAARQSLEIKYVFLSHFHADFLAGHLELRARVGAKICLGDKAEAEYEITPFEDGEELLLGNVKLKILHTPGHTPESICIAVYDLAKDKEQPHAVLTGDTLFIGDVGRPDLRASLGWSADDLGALLYDSLHQKLMTLPDDTLVYPTHGAGSMCGKHLSKETVSTIGVQREYNYALQPMSKQSFIDIVTADQPDAPDYFTYDAVLNTKEHTTLDKTLEETLKPLDLAAALDQIEGGASVPDVREPVDFEGAHLKGSLSIALDGKYATWAGTLLSPEEHIVIVAEPGREEEAAIRLGRIGFDNVSGYLQGGMQALSARQDLVVRSERVTAANLAEQMDTDEVPVVLDVRTENEWAEEHIGGSVNIPLNHLKERVDELPEGRRVAVHCASGYRSCVALSLLEPKLGNSVMNLVGGLAAWEAAGLETVSSSKES